MMIELRFKKKKQKSSTYKKIKITNYIQIQWPT